MMIIMIAKVAPWSAGLPHVRDGAGRGGRHERRAPSRIHMT